jgi:hypothetical protein
MASLARLHELQLHSPPGHKSVHSEGNVRTLSALRGLRHGSVKINVHDPRMVQIEKNETLRLLKKTDGEIR